MLGWVSLGIVSACVWHRGCVQRTLVRRVRRGLFARLGWVGSIKGSPRDSNSHGNTSSGRGLGVQLPLQVPRDGEREKWRERGEREAFCLSTLDKTKTTHSSGFMPHFLFINKLLAVKT